METDKNLSVVRLLHLDLIRRSSNQKELIWIVVPDNIFILISFKEKVFTQINSQQMSTFRSSSRVDCVIEINFNLNARS